MFKFIKRLMAWWKDRRYVRLEKKYLGDYKKKTGIYHPDLCGPPIAECLKVGNRYGDQSKADLQRKLYVPACDGVKVTQKVSFPTVPTAAKQPTGYIRQAPHHHYDGITSVGGAIYQDQVAAQRARKVEQEDSSLPNFCAPEGFSAFTGGFSPPPPAGGYVPSDAPMDAPYDAPAPDIYGENTTEGQAPAAESGGYW